MSEPVGVEVDVVEDLTAEREGDSSLVRSLRRQLKERSREVAELRQGAAPAPDGDEDAPRGLRQALERANARVRELEAAQRGQVLKATFDAAGVPDGPLRGLLGEKLNGDGDVSVDGLRQWMAEAGVQPFDPVAAHRSGATQRIDDLRASATPVGSQKLGFQDYQQLVQQNPAAAASALAAGSVDLPSAIAMQLQANRDERQQGFGVFGD